MTFVTKLAILKEAREVIREPHNWTQRTYARDMSGDIVTPGDKRACRFCSLGAIHKALQPKVIEFNMSSDVYDNLYESVKDSLNGQLNPSCSSIVYFNDHSKHEDILEMFDKTICKLEQGNV